MGKKFYAVWLQTLSFYQAQVESFWQWFFSAKCENAWDFHLFPQSFFFYLLQFCNKKCKQNMKRDLEALQFMLFASCHHSFLSENGIYSKWKDCTSVKDESFELFLNYSKKSSRLNINCAVIKTSNISVLF